jgi:peptide/nickel transport system permease protein
VFAPWIAPQDPIATSWGAIRKAPSAEHWFGTDEIGRDVLSRVIWGTRASLLAGVVRVDLAAARRADRPAGRLPGRVRRRLISRITDAFLACPFLILAIAMAAFLGPSLTNAMIAIGVSATPIFVRLTRAQVINVKVEDYVEAARAVGNPPLRIALRTSCPTSLAPLIVQATLAIAAAVIAEASLSFLGWASSRRRRAGAACSMWPRTMSITHPGWRSGPACRSSCWCWPSTCWATACAMRWTRASADPAP